MSPEHHDIVAALRAELAARDAMIERLTRAIEALAAGRGAAAPPSTVTWREGFKLYLAWYAAEHKASSMRTVERQGKQLLAGAFVDKPIASLHFADIDAYKVQRRSKPSLRKKTISDVTLDQEVCLALTVINWLSKPGRQAQTGIVANPLASYPMRTQSRGGKKTMKRVLRRKVWSLDEEAKILGEAKHPALRAVIALELGFFRPSEALNLEREQFVDRGEGWYVVELRGDQTKNGHPRTIPVAPSTMTFVRELPGWRSFARRPFENPDTNAPHPVTYMDELFKLAREAACVPAQGRTLYSFRATGATRALEAGVPLMIVAELMGHQDAGQTIQRHYHEATDDARVRAMQIIEAAKTYPDRHPPHKAANVAQSALENRPQYVRK